ncbi:MAG: hypothetical protein RSH79_04775 [Clostridiales bacterium]
MRMNKLYKKIAKKNGVSVAKVKEDIEKAIALSTINTQSRKITAEDFFNIAVENVKSKTNKL